VADLPRYQTTMTVIEQATGMRFNLGPWDSKSLEKVFILNPN
jgi:hypothetical protein